MLKHEEEVFCNFCRNPREVQNDSASLFPENISLAMAYVPFQRWQNIYDVDDAFGAGTLFADLDKPFLGYGKGHRR
ncbi:MAG: spore coat associated protein CotJA [Ruminococcaceae bacterium]|nr:spore coat associated protein CotJA [Oscillospiraceae bacterium]